MCVSLSLIYIRHDYALGYVKHKGPGSLLPPLPTLSSPEGVRERERKRERGGGGESYATSTEGEVDRKGERGRRRGVWR